MPTVHYEVWLGEICLGQIDNKSGLALDTKFYPKIEGPAVDIISKNRYPGHLDCFRGVAHLVPEECRPLLRLWTYEAGRVKQRQSGKDIL